MKAIPRRRIGVFLWLVGAALLGVSGQLALSGNPTWLLPSLLVLAVGLAVDPKTGE